MLYLRARAFAKVSPLVREGSPFNPVRVRAHRHYDDFAATILLSATLVVHVDSDVKRSVAFVTKVNTFGYFGVCMTMSSRFLCHQKVRAGSGFLYAHSK
jgi:hypothetical protein